MSQAELAWLVGRQHGVGSSESPVITLGRLFDKTAVDIYIGKKRTLSLDDVVKENPNFRRGHTYEPLALALFQDKTGVNVFYPKTDQERFVDFQVWDPKHKFLFADFDGLAEDGWVMEIKSPLQRVADAIRSSGVKDYYQIQAQHLAHCANVCTLPYLGNKWKGKIKGTRLVVYECEKVDIQIYELPLDQEWADMIIENDRLFWKSVETNTPPQEPEYTQPVKIESKGGTYKQLEGPAWEEAVQRYKLAQERSEAAARMFDSAKDMMKKAMEDAGEDAIQIGRNKFLYREQAGRAYFDKKAFMADHPNLDLSKYDKKGKPTRPFRNWGPKNELKEEMQEAAAAQNETLDSQLITLSDELEFFSKQRLEPEHAVAVYDELRERAELYVRVLGLETNQIERALEKAATAATKMITN